MIDRLTAQRRVLSALNKGQLSPDDELVLLDDETMETPYGWVFFYTSRRFLDTGDPLDSLAGNGPIIVDRADGSVHPQGTAYPPEVYMAEYEATRGATPRLEFAALEVVYGRDVTGNEDAPSHLTLSMQTTLCGLPIATGAPPGRAFSRGWDCTACYTEAARRRLTCRRCGQLMWNEIDPEVCYACRLKQRFAALP